LIVILEDGVFASAPTLQIQSILRLGFEGWHLVQTDPPFDPATERAVNRWLGRQDRSAREQAALAFEIGMEEDVTGVSSEIVLRIEEAGTLDWDASPLKLPMDKALQLLQMPLRLLVENRRNDGAFLRKFVPEDWRPRFLRAIEAGCIVFEHGGGSDMKARVRDLAQEETLRAWALFDSDAREPGRPSKASEDLRSTCLDKRVPHHRLLRRSIENYLPVKALQAWAQTSAGNLRRSRRQAANAFAGMRPEHRHHYNMKGGFSADRRGKEGVPDFYQRLADDPHLQKGFSDDIASLFLENAFPIREEWLLQDGQQQEALEVAQAIFRRI
jgi:hypothetical protein